MDIETIMSLCIVMGTLNLPFYAMTLENWKAMKEVKARTLIIEKEIKNGTYRC